MNLNLTLLGQMITFAIFVWFTMKYVWPPVTSALRERQKKIADGLEAAERSQRDLELTERKVTDMLREAKEGASHILEEANKRAAQIVEEAKDVARSEGERLIENAKSEIDQEILSAKDALRKHIGGIAVQTAEKILKSKIDESKHQQLIEQAIEEI